MTLAPFLSRQGVVLVVAEEGGTLRIGKRVIIAMANRNVPLRRGWVTPVIGLSTGH